MTLRQSVLSGLRWTAGARAISQFLSWAGTILVIRILSPDDYGIIAIGGFFILYLLLLSEGGLSDALIRHPDLSEPLLKEVQGILLLINGTCCVLLAASAPLLADYFNEPMLRQVLPVLAVQFLIISVGIIPYAMLAREMRFKALSTLSIFQAAFVSAITVILALLGAGVWSLVVSNLAGLLLRSIALIAMTRQFHVPVFRFREARVFTGFSGYVLMDRTVWHFLANVDALLVGKLLGTTATGVYSVAQNFASIPISKVAGILAQVALPAFSKIQQDTERVRSSYILAMKNVAIFSFPIGFGLAAVAVPLVDLVLGDKWASVQTIFLILAFSIPFRLMSSFDSPLLLALGLPKIMLQNRILSLAILVVALIIATQWGLTGVAIAWAIAAPLIWVSTTLRFCYTLSWRAAAVLNTATAPLLAATLMFVGIVLLDRHLGESLHPALVLSIEIPIGAVIYLAGLYLFARAQLTEALTVVKGILSTKRAAT